MCNGDLPLAPVERAAQNLAVDRHNPFAWLGCEQRLVLAQIATDA